MNRIVLFEVGRANVGDGRQRSLVSELLRDWNRALTRKGVKLTGAVGHTGNYLVEAEGGLGLEDIAGLFRGLGAKMAVFTASEFAAWATAANQTLSRLPDAPQGRRPTPGVVMDLNPAGAVPKKPPSSERIRFASFAVPRVRGVWKLDVLRPDGKALDRTKREGGWGSVSKAMHDCAGGEWTARSMRTINRLLAKMVAVP